MKRSELKRKKPISQTRSWKHGKQAEAEITEIRDAVRRRSRGVCERCLDAPAEQLHHRLMRSQGGRDSRENLVHVCSYCHINIHMNPSDSYEAGWLVHRWLDPADVPWSRP